MRMFYISYFSENILPFRHFARRTPPKINAKGNVSDINNQSPLSSTTLPIQKSSLSHGVSFFRVSNKRYGS